MRDMEDKFMLRDELVKFCENSEGKQCQITTKAGNVYKGILTGCKVLAQNNLKLAKVQITLEDGNAKEFMCNAIATIKTL